jgi:hypothetical protein
MPAITRNRLKGNYGAALVSSRLSGECLVRPVAADTDVGIDLYCETAAEDRPFLHFWLQVKTGDQCKVDASRGSAKCSFDGEHLNYWFRQPVPVYAALVPSEWPVVEEPAIHIIDITTQILDNQHYLNQQSITLESDYSWQVGDRSSVVDFLEQVVPATAARLQVRNGVVARIPQQTTTYVHTTPSVPVLAFQKEILSQLRSTAAHAIMFSAGDEQTEMDVEFRRFLARIIELFTKSHFCQQKDHWENFFSRALSRHLDESYAEAALLYDEAQNCIHADSYVRDECSWQLLAAKIGDLKHVALRQRPLTKEDLESEYVGS